MTQSRQKMLDWLDLQTGWTHKGGLWPDKEKRKYMKIRKLIIEAPMKDSESETTLSAR